MSIDNLCKYLSEKYPDRFATWVLGEPPTVPVTLLKTELSIEPIQADFVTFLNLRDQILHLEFQVNVASEPPLPLRMLDYWVRLYRRHRVPITQVLVLLRPPPEGTVIDTEFRVETTHHLYRVTGLWEQDPEPLLQDPALLPLAALAAGSPDRLLSQIAQRISQIESVEAQQEVLTCTRILAGLRYSRALINQFLREGVMRESVIYQDILQEGLQAGRQEGLQAGRQEGLQAGRQEGEVLIILRLLTRRLGAIDSETQAQIEALSLTQLEDLAEALLDFSTVANLTTWLAAHAV